MLRSSLILALSAVPALAQVPRVVVDLPVAQSLVAQVMGELGTPELLLDRGADPHSVQLRPSQARALAGAGLVVWTGEGMSPWLEEPVSTLAGGRVLDLDAVEGLYQQGFLPSALLDEDGNDDHEEEGHDDHDEHGHEGHDHGHDHGAVDPHLWLDPQNAATWLRAIAAELSSLDPANAGPYAANAEAAVARTQALQAEVAAILAPVGDAGLVMFHDAYGYFVTVYGLNVLGTVTLGDAAAPGAARLSGLRAGLEAAGAVCLFPEVNHPADFAELVIEGTGVRLGAPLDPAGVMLEPGAGLYGDLMRGLATAIAECVAGE